MTSPKWSSRVAYFLVVGTLAVLSTNGLAETAPQTRTPGKQFMVAQYTKIPPAIDGVFSPAEWGRAIPVFVEGSRSPATPPGVVPNIGLPYLFTAASTITTTISGVSAGVVAANLRLTYWGVRVYSKTASGD